MNKLFIILNFNLIKKIYHLICRFIYDLLQADMILTQFIEDCYNRLFLN